MSAVVTSMSNKARGFTMVEALIALLVLSIGLLGVGLMQFSSLRSNHGSSLRSQATFLAYDVTDRMRANRAAATAGGYDIAIGAAPAGAAVADNDLVRWKQNLAATLPAGDGSVARTQVVRPAGPLGAAVTVTTFTITVQWDDSRGTEPPLQFVMETQI
ncbi:MAG: type IV pilus modification protein PilV [Steroidobacteraceae bacterium]